MRPGLSAGQERPKARPKPPADVTTAVPATIADAVKILDLSRFPVLENAALPVSRGPARLTYEAPATVLDAWAFQQKELTRAGWQELHAYPTEQSASATFSRKGYTIGVLIMPASQPKRVAVRIVHLGNVDLARLPTPSGSRPLHIMPGRAAFLTTEPVTETAAKLQEALVAQRWEPYGEAEAIQYYKRNAVRLDVRVTTAPAQGGKTLIEFTSMLMSVDLPALPHARHVHYAEDRRELYCETALEAADVVHFYRSKLAETGWQPTTDHPVENGRESFLIFRNPAEDLLTLTMRKLDDGLRVTMRCQSVAEIEAEKAALEKALAEDRKARAAKELEPAVAPITIPIPAEAKDVEASDDVIEFTMPRGKGKPLFDKLRKQFREQGWTEQMANLENIGGSLVLQKDNALLTITFADFGAEPAEIHILSLGGRLRRQPAAPR